MTMIWIYSVFLCVGVGSPQLITSEIEGRQFLEKFDREASRIFSDLVFAMWEYQTNLNTVNQDAMTRAIRRYSEYRKQQSIEAAKFKWDNFKDNSMRRQFEKLLKISPRSNPSIQEKMSRTEADMTTIYSKAEVCLGGRTDNCLKMNRDIKGMMATERDETELLALWTGWRNVTGRRLRSKFTDYVRLSNQDAVLNGYRDKTDEWKKAYESDTFDKDIRRLFNKLRPIYKQLHAYIHRKLMSRYGRRNFPDSGHIPAHLLGNMWGQKWNNIYDIVKPYPEVLSTNVTKALLDRGYKVADVFKLSEDFYVSLGFERMTMDFWNHSLAAKPVDREVICNPSAWDFSNGRDFRVKMCAKVDEEYFLTIHHEMGHSVYQMSYRHQPFLFRDGANPGFHEAMADLASLSIRTPEHLQTIQLIQNIPVDNKNDINFLMSVALDTLASLPFTYLLDQWKWDVFRGRTTSFTYNRDWWRLRCKYQGISPPVLRTEEDFDPGAKYHVSTNMPAIHSFVSTILQFHWHEALCDKTRHQGPLHRCDIFNNWQAGSHLRQVLELGSSRPWQEAMRILTGQRSMSAEPLLRYFRPLTKWLEKENRGHKLGWDYQCPKEMLYSSSNLSATSSRLLLVLSFLCVSLLRQSV